MVDLQTHPIGAAATAEHCKTKCCRASGCDAYTFAIETASKIARSLLLPPPSSTSQVSGRRRQEARRVSISCWRVQGQPFGACW